MVRLRFQRLGRHKRPFFRLAAIDQRTRRNGTTIENLGWYNPLETDPAKQMSLDAERIKHWDSHGAQPTDTVRDILVKANLMDKAQWEKDRAHARKAVEKKVADKAAADAAKGEEKK